MKTKINTIYTKELDFSILDEEFFLALLNDILEYRKTLEAKNELPKN